MAESTFQRAFAGGELAPSLAARADQVKYVTGLRTCRNFIVLRHGGVSNRAGTRFVGATRDSSVSSFLLRYVSDVAADSVLLEAGPFYLRVYKNGALVTLASVAAYDGGHAYAIGDIAATGGANYYAVAAGVGHTPTSSPAYWYAMPGDILEIPTPFGNAGFAWVQSGNVLTLTSPLVRPHELIYGSLTQWILQPVATKPSIGPPTGLLVTGGAAGTLSYQYVVTAAASDSYEESIAGPITQVSTIAVPTPAAPNVLTWTAPAGALAAEYYVYCDPYGNGTFGFLGAATGLTTFRDIGYIPDFSVTPPLPRVLFATAGDYPARAGYYQQRRFFANSLNNPDAVWGSRVGFRSNFSVSSPLQDDDAITFRLAGNQANPVRHVLGMKTLVVLTDGGIWSVGQVMTPLTPANLPAGQESFVGGGAPVPVIVGNSLLFVQVRGSILRDLQIAPNVYSLTTGKDLTIFAAHLVDGFTLPHVDYQETPHSIIWAVRSDGMLLGLTYIADQEIWGWHRHDTGANGRFEDVCVVPEADEDVVYLLVRRSIGGVFKRYIERLERREILNFAADSFFVDAGLTYTGPPVTTISGLAHLNGQVVAVVADGAVVFNGDPSSPRAASFTVTGGTIPATLPAASIIHAGLPIRFAEIETLDLDVETQGGIIRDKKKRVDSVSLLLDASVRTFAAGPDPSHLTTVTLKTYETGLERVPFTGLEELSLSTDFSPYGRVFIRHTDPLPLTILGVLPHVTLGG